MNRVSCRVLYPLSYQERYPGMGTSDQAPVHTCLRIEMIPNSNLVHCLWNVCCIMKWKRVRCHCAWGKKWSWCVLSRHSRQKRNSLWCVFLHQGTVQCANTGANISTMKPGSFSLCLPNFNLINEVPGYLFQGKTDLAYKSKNMQIFLHSKFGIDRSPGHVMAKNLNFGISNFLAITFEPVVRLISNFECGKICIDLGLFAK